MIEKAISSLRQLSRIGFAWHWPAKGCPDGSRLRAIARRHRFHRFPAIAQLLLRGTATLLWPFGVLDDLQLVGRILHRRRTDGKAAITGYHPLNAFLFALRHNVSPREYLIYQLWLPEHQTQIDAFLYSNERLGLMLALNGKPLPVERNPIESKLALARLCEREDIAHPTLYAPKPDGAETPPPPKGDLWEKPTRGYHGRSHRHWVQIEPGQFESESDQKSLSDLIADVTTRKESVLQAKAENHPDLTGFTNGALVVIRLVTGLKPDGQAVPLFATIQFPFGEANQSRSGLIGRLDVKSGNVQTVKSTSAFYEPEDMHPDTGKTFLPLTVPLWSDALAETCRLHTHISNYTLIGWDIAITPDGPVILEGNSSWNSEQHQEASPAPTPILPMLPTLKQTDK